jgi:hypothetical protein
VNIRAGIVEEDSEVEHILGLAEAGGCEVLLSLSEPELGKSAEVISRIPGTSERYDS